jgi:hypothetical protein
MPPAARLVIEPAARRRKSPLGMSIPASLVRRQVGAGKNSFPAPNAKNKENPMKFMSMVKSNENVKAYPPPEMMEAMGKLIEKSQKDGTLVITGGLAPTATAVRMRLENGQIRVLDGPYSEAKEVVGGFAILNLESREKAVEAAKDFLELHRRYWPGWTGECEIRQMFGPDDFDPDFKG